MHKFRILSDKTFSEIEEKFKQLEERLSKTEKMLSNLETNVADTRDDIEKLELIKSKIEIFNMNMSFTTDQIYLEINDDHVDLVRPSLDETDQSKLIVVHLHEPIDKIERRLGEQIKALEFYHCFLSQLNVGRLVEFSVDWSDYFIARLRFKLGDQSYGNDEMTIDLMKSGKIDVEYRKYLNIDIRKKLEFGEHSKIRFEILIPDIIGNCYDEYLIKAITSEVCEIADFKEVMTRLQEEIEMNGQFRQLKFQAEN